MTDQPIDLSKTPEFAIEEARRRNELEQQVPGFYRTPAEKLAELAKQATERSRVPGQRYDVSIPVTIRMIGNNVIGADVDFDGAPWMYADSEANVWDVDADDWIRDETIEQIAIEALSVALARQFDGGEEQKPWPITP